MKDFSTGGIRGPQETIERHRLVSRADAAFYCGISLQTFSHWVSNGTLPSPLSGTTRWDLKAIDARLDILSGLAAPAELAPLDSWRRNVRVVLKGIHKVKKRLANGEIKIHFYAWRGGPAIHAKPGTSEFVYAYNQAHNSIRQPQAGTLMTIIADYKASPEYTRLAQSTRRSYSLYIKLIEDAFGDLPLAALTDRRVRGEFKTWRDSFAATPRKADFAWTVLARIMSFAKDRGMILTNPCEKGGRLYVADRTEKVWGEQEIGAVLAVASPEIKLALVLALWTGQRQGDLLRLPWSSYDGTHVRFRQSKTGRRVTMPAGMPLKVLLDGAERRSPLILTNSYGRPWTSDGFRTSWSKTCARARVSALTFHDLRGSAVVRLALAEATVPQIATFTGHSLKDVEAILDAHYLGRDVQLAEAAVLKLEKRTKL